MYRAALLFAGVLLTLAPARLAAQNAPVITPEIAVILDVAGAVFDGPIRQTGGHDPQAEGFNLQQLELSMGAAVDPYFRMDVNLVFALFGVELEEAYGTSMRLPGGLQLRAGQFLTRFGRINPTHPHSWDFVDQPIVIGKHFGSEGSRGLGVELSWLVPLPWFAEVVASVNNAEGGATARSFYGNNAVPVDGLEDLLYTTALKQFHAMGANWGLHWGVSAQHGPNGTGYNNRTAIYGADLHLRFRPVDSPRRTALTWQSEVLWRQRQLPDASLEDVGLYTQLVWNITPRWAVGARYEWVSGDQDDDLDPEWTDARHRTTAQVTFYPSHFSRLRLQGAVDEPTWSTPRTYAGFLAAEFLIGAHGTHDY